MKKNDLDCFDINGGAILYKKNVTKKPITAKTLTQLLHQFYPANAADKADELTKFILENREETTKETILRKMNKLSGVHLQVYNRREYKTTFLVLKFHFLCQITDVVENVLQSFF